MKFLGLWVEGRSNEELQCEGPILPTLAFFYMISEIHSWTEKRVFLFENTYLGGRKLFVFQMYIFEVLVGWKMLGSNLMGVGIDTNVLYYTSRLFGYVSIDGTWRNEVK